MNRSKQQALMFLLGAVLVGGVLGFSADRMLANEHDRRNPRVSMYDDLQLTVAQRARMDSLLDASNCERKAVLKTVQPQLDSLRRVARLRMDSVLTPEQRARLEARRKEESARADAYRREHRCP